MKLELINLVNNDEKNYTNFLKNINSNLVTKLNKSEIIENNEWIDEVLFTIPYVIKAFENANKNLITEEEVLKMELIKKVSVDSIKHLSKHTNFVTKFNEKTGEVIPNKLLNSNKEETYETYENRFLYSLVLLIEDFITVRSRASKNGTISKGKNHQQAFYEAHTKFRKEKINLKFEYNAERFEGEENDDQIELKIRKIQNELKMAKATEIYRTLNSHKIVLVKSPLKMTNVLLKNVNYQYAVRLWDYLQENFDLKNKSVQRKREQEEKGTTKKLIDQDFLLKYIIFNNINSQRSKKSNKKLALTKEEKDEVTNSLIQQIIKLNPEMLEVELKKMISEKYIQYKRMWTISLKPIENRFKMEIKEYMKAIEKNKL